MEKSAYLILGLPGNATQADIHATYQRLVATFSQDKLATDAAARKLHREIQEAYALLKAPELRAAYDRELSGLRKPERDTRNTSTSPAPLHRQPWLLFLLVLLASGAYAVHYRSTERKAVAERAAAQAAELKKKEAAEALLTQQKLDAETAALQREQLRQQREDQQRERQERSAADASAARAASLMERQQDQARRQLESSKRETEREQIKTQQAERQRVQEAELRVAKEKQILRELCYQRYGRPDC